MPELFSSSFQLGLRHHRLRCIAFLPHRTTWPLRRQPCHPLRQPRPRLQPPLPLWPCQMSACHRQACPRLRAFPHLRHTGCQPRCQLIPTLLPTTDPLRLALLPTGPLPPGCLLGVLSSTSRMTPWRRSTGQWRPRTGGTANPNRCSVGAPLRPGGTRPRPLITTGRPLDTTGTCRLRLQGKRV